MTDLQKRAQALKLYGLLAHFDDVAAEPWVPDLLDWEEKERSRRGLERRIRRARLGTFKPLDDFDWSWPKKIDRTQIEDLFRLEWLASATNIILVGPNGVGKTLIAKNLAHQAVLSGATARFLTASELLNSLAELDSSTSLQRRLNLFARPQLLILDELGYLSYDTRHADLLFEVVSRRYEKRATHHQQALRRVGRSLSQRHLRRHHRRPPGPSLRGRQSRRRVLPLEGIQGSRTPACQEARRSASQVLTLMIRNDYLAEVIRLYLLAPDTPRKASRRDWAIAGDLFQQRIPLQTIAHAIRFATLRRHLRDPELGPLEPIHSLAYYRRVVDLFAPMALDPGYVDYVAWKYRRCFPDESAA